jgi:hypothetical protein
MPDRKGPLPMAPARRLQARLNGLEDMAERPWQGNPPPPDMGVSWPPARPSTRPAWMTRVRP